METKRYITNERKNQQRVLVPPKHLQCDLTVIHHVFGIGVENQFSIKFSFFI